MHDEAQLNTVATGCGLALGELIQDDSEKKLLIAIRQNPTEDQRRCVIKWARANGLRTVFVNMLFQNEVSENDKMTSLLAAASLVFTLSRVEPTYLPAININGSVHRIVALTVAGPPDLIPSFRERLSKDGWKVMPSADNNWTIVSPAGHSIDEVTALSFRVNNGEFGNLKFSVQLGPELDMGH